MTCDIPDIKHYFMYTLSPVNTGRHTVTPAYQADTWHRKRIHGDSISLKFKRFLTTNTCVHVFLLRVVCGKQHVRGLRLERELRGWYMWQAVSTPETGSIDFTASNSYEHET